jgi:nucleotide-binding universal stress UspA family protein
MLKSILLVLDDTPGAVAARDGAIAFARGCGASVTAAAFLDTGHLADAHEAVPPGAGAFKERRDARRLSEARAAAEAQLAAFRAVAPDWPGTIHDDGAMPGLKRLAVAHDVIAIGRDSTLGVEGTEEGLAPTIERIAHDPPRPLVVVPPPGAAATDGPFIVAYDGSVPCQRSLQMFVQLGLAALRPIRVVSVADTEAEARALAGGAASYLALHGIAAETDALTGRRPADAVLDHAARLDAGLLMIGAFETPRLRTLLFGSGTLRILRGSRCPVFVHH